MKDYLKKIITEKSAKIDEMRSMIKTSESIDEVRKLTADAEALQAEVREAQNQLDQIEANESRGTVPTGAVLVNGTVRASAQTPEARKSDNVLESFVAEVYYEALPTQTLIGLVGAPVPELV